MAEKIKGNVFGVISGKDLAKFTSLVALFAILADSAIGHGLTWENDPYWTYWVTKTFLIATVFGLGTALIGIGRLRGAILTLVHTLILTVYYWSLSPIGLPSSANWLDLEHTWITGVPIHFGVIYLGYLTALWFWRNRKIADLDSRQNIAAQSLIAGITIVVVCGIASNLVLGEFSGVTWYVTRLLITATFLLLWWGVVVRSTVSTVIGALVLTAIWADYSQYLSPVGLPSMPLRIFSQAPPPANVHWLNFNELWLISVPIYLVAILSIMAIFRRHSNKSLAPALPLVGLLALIIVCFAVNLIPQKNTGQKSHITASGRLFVENGAYYSNNLRPGNGTIDIKATKNSGRVSPLPPHDEINLSAKLNIGGHEYQIVAKDPMVEDPLGQFTTWWGVGLDVWHHGNSGIGTSKLPYIDSKLAVFAMGDLSRDGQPVASGVSIHAMTAEKGLAKDSKLELDVGDPRMSPLPNVPSGHIRVLWQSFSGHISDHSSTLSYILGDLVLLGLLIGGLAVNSGSSKVMQSRART
jgi:hypothetical protein